MNLQIFTVYDTKSELYGAPMFMTTNAQAIRGLTDEVNREAPDNQLYHHAADFILYALGMWDNSEGKLVPEAPRLVIRAEDLKR